MTDSKKSKETTQKLRIKVSAFESKILDSYVAEIIDNANRYEAEVCGPIPLPTKVKRYTVNRSTFVHKDSREQFEMKVHTRLIDILNPTQKIIEALSNLSLPSGVNVDIKMV